MKIIPLLDRVLLKPVKKDSITESGIYIPDGANKERPYMYEVVEVGEGKRDKDGAIIKIPVKKGDKVLTGQYSGDDIKIENEEYKIIASEYILAIFEN